MYEYISTHSQRIMCPDFLIVSTGKPCWKVGSTRSPKGVKSHLFMLSYAPDYTISKWKPVPMPTYAEQCIILRARYLTKHF